MSGPLGVPSDEVAEITAVGACVDMHANYRRLSATVSADDFYWPAHRRLFEACGQLAHLDGSSLEIRDERMKIAARLAGLSDTALHSIMERRCVRDDVNSVYARRVHQAANARRVMQAAGNVFNRLGAGECVEDVLGEELKDVLGEVPLLAGAMRR